MKKIGFFYKYASILAVFLVALFLKQSPAPAAVFWPHENSDFEPDPNVIFGTLDNGFRYVLMKNNEPRDRVSMHLNVQVGSLHEGDNERGLAHFLEHMLFQGSENFEPGELVKYFQSIGMQFGPDANAHTGFDETVYDIILPDGRQDSIAKGLIVMKDYAQGALLMEEQIENEKKVILAEKRSRDSASYRTFEATLDFEFPESLLSKRLPIGIDDTIKRTDRNLMAAFYDAWYRPEKMILVMVGDFDSDAAEDLIKETFKDMKARAEARPEPNLGKVSHHGIKPFYHFEEETGDASASIEVLEIVEPESDTVERRTRLLKKDMADAIIKNRLDALLKKADTPFTSASIGSTVFLKQFFYAEISAESSAGNWEKSLAAIEQELRKALRFGFSESELDRVKKDYLTRLDLDVQKASTRDTRYLANEIIRASNADRVFMSPQQLKDFYAPIVQSLTLEQVHEAFKDSWNRNHRLVTVTGNAPVKKDGGSSDPAGYVLSVFNQSRDIAVAINEAVAPAVFPYLPKPDKPGTVSGKTEDAELDIVMVDFENGLRLNYKKTDFKAREIKIKLDFGFGKYSEPAEKTGLSILAQEVVNESGVGDLNADDLNRALAGKTTTVEFDIEEDTFALVADTTPDELELAFQLLYARLVDQAFRKQAYDLAMERYRLSYQENMRSVEGFLKLNADRFLAGGDSRFGYPDFEAFRMLTLQDVRDWIGSALKFPLEVSVVGDFDPDALTGIVARYLGSLPKTADSDDAVSKRKPPRFPVKESLELPVDTQIPKAIAIVAYPTDDFWNIGKTRRLSILSEVVSERLRVTVREKLGASYSPFSYNRPSKAYKGYGVFREVVFAEPEKAKQLVSVMKQIASDINDKGIEDDELKRSLEPVLTGIKEMRRKNEYWLRSVLSGAVRNPEQIQWAHTILQDYGSITAEEILALSERYLDNEKSATIIITPKKGD